MAWDANLTNLKYVLADYFPFKEGSYSIVRDAGLPLGQISWQDKGINNWSEILNEADKQGKVSAVVQVALRQYPQDPFLLSALKGTLTPVQNLVDETLSWENTETVETLEVLMGERSTFLPVHWLELGAQCARSVAKVVHPNKAYGTGFLTLNNIFVTNNHVLETIDQARKALIYFNDQANADGLGYIPTKFEIDPDKGFKTSVENDWTFVRVKGDANADWGAIVVEPVEIELKQRANIIQHPGGESKQIAIYNNRVTEVSETYIRYTTDTLGGSSGSPVFDDEWHLIALHQKAGYSKVIGSKRIIRPNKGININCLLVDLKQML
jgi:Trypsin-like peptidase domain/Effector-associated domain 1